MKPFLIAMPLLLPLPELAARSTSARMIPAWFYSPTRRPARRIAPCFPSNPAGRPSGGNGTKARAAATPTPGDFPRVSGNEQKARDSDRRAILDKELANELQSVDEGKRRRPCPTSAITSPWTLQPLQGHGCLARAQCRVAEEGTRQPPVSGGTPWALRGWCCFLHKSSVMNATEPFNAFSGLDLLSTAVVLVDARLVIRMSIRRRKTCSPSVRANCCHPRNAGRPRGTQCRARQCAAEQLELYRAQPDQARAMARSRCSSIAR
jgi:hypothetical protein